MQLGCAPTSAIAKRGSGRRIPLHKDLKRALKNYHHYEGQLRARHAEPVIEPASLFVSHWSQSDYLELSERFITDHASRILLMDGWEFSAGCASEFCRAHLDGVPTARIDGTPVVARDGIAAIRRALAEVETLDPVPLYLAETLRATADRLEATLPAIVYVPSGGNVGACRAERSLSHRGDAGPSHRRRGK